MTRPTQKITNAQRLYAKLLEIEYWQRKSIAYPDGGLLAQWAYKDFLRSQCDHGHTNCYAIALRAIGGAS